ncbi:MAG: gamma-glutamyl-gamma-aminobutyrate hydrolase family protein [Candidatus Riflebacteria bacterium]|nr:gamma-glutamyl-gamma-aminobutyrate hydrolase family protein [Candidatus Riflebacteria bacterium]
MTRPAPPRYPWPLIAVLLLLCVQVFLAGPACGQGSAPATPPVTVRIGLVYTATQAVALAGGQDPLDQYRKAIARPGVEIVPLLVSDSEFVTNEKTRLLDGLVLPGGCDIDPALYGEEPHHLLETVDRSLDSLEFFLLEFTRKMRLPVLGICRGHQVINVFLGGSLYQDLPSQLDGEVRVSHRRKEDGETRRVAHGIAVATGSRLFEVFATATWDVNSFHHQSVKKLGNDLRATAWSADGVVEAVEGTTDWYVLGVQFHPEKDLQRDPRLALVFSAFVEVVRDRRARGDGR